MLQCSVYATDTNDVSNCLVEERWAVTCDHPCGKEVPLIIINVHLYCTLNVISIVMKGCIIFMN